MSRAALALAFVVVAGWPVLARANDPSPGNEKAQTAPGIRHRCSEGQVLVKGAKGWTCADLPAGPAGPPGPPGESGLGFPESTVVRVPVTQSLREVLAGLASDSSSAPSYLVVLDVGTYDLGPGVLLVPENVRILGADRERTILRGADQIQVFSNVRSLTFAVPVRWDSFELGRDLHFLSSLALYRARIEDSLVDYGGSSPAVTTGFGKHPSLRRVAISAPRGTAIYAALNGGVSIDDCDVAGLAGVIIGQQDDAVILRSRVSGNPAVTSAGLNNLLIEDSDIRTAGPALPPYDPQAILVGANDSLTIVRSRITAVGAPGIVFKGDPSSVGTTHISITGSELISTERSLDLDTGTASHGVAEIADSVLGGPIAGSAFTCSSVFDRELRPLGPDCLPPASP